MRNNTFTCPFCSVPAKILFMCKTFYSILFVFCVCREQIKLVCDILKMLLSNIEPDNVLDQFHTELLTGMTVSEDKVRELCVKQVRILLYQMI